MPKQESTPWDPDPEEPPATDQDRPIELDRVEVARPGAAEERIAELETQLHDAQQRVLRAQAELENSRRRLRREMDEERRYASQNLITDLLPVLDNVSRAIESAEKVEPDSSIVQGVRMVAQLLEGVLTKHHCPRIAAHGQEFDPTEHEAIAQQPSDSIPAGAVVFVAQEGYRLHDRVVRPAQVIVSTGPTPRPN